MNILERTTTEEYDEDGRLTSRTTVEKYAPEAQEIKSAPTAKEKGKQFFEELYADLKNSEKHLSTDGEDKEYKKGFAVGFKTCMENVKLQYEIWNCYDIWNQELPNANA